MTTRAEDYASISRLLLEEGQHALEEGGVLQASEKLWGAAAHMVKAVAERREWPHSSHRELFRVVNRLAQEIGDTEIRNLFRLANSLHTNFYENWMTEEYVQDGVGQIEEFVSRLERT